MSRPTAPRTTAQTGASATSSVAETATSSARFAAGPVTGSGPLEIALALPVGDVPIEEPLLGPRVVEVVVDDLVAEGRPGDAALLQRRDRLPQRRREAQLVLDPVDAGGDHRREREVRVDVAAGNPRLDPKPLSMPDDAKAAGAVVVAPGERRRRPAAGRIALVRVDRRREEDRELLRARDLTGEEAAEHGRRGVAPGEGVAPIAPEARVDVARVADPRLERLRHEADRAAVQEGDLLGAVLVDHVVVRHRQGVREAEVDLLLAGPRLALGRLHPDPGRLHVVADRAQQRLVVRGREDVVVEDVRD